MSTEANAEPREVSSAAPLAIVLWVLVTRGAALRGGEDRHRGGGAVRRLRRQAPTASLVGVRRDPLYDGHGRRISDLRVSVTDRCNFRCQYCMPADGLPWLDREEILRFEEIERLVSVMAEMGVTDLRLTGGEPLVRREFPRLVGCWPPCRGSRTSR